MTRDEAFRRADEMLEKLLDLFDGTPEEFGALVVDATMTIDPGVNRAANVAVKYRARARICELEGGLQYLAMEEKLYKM